MMSRLDQSSGKTFPLKLRDREIESSSDIGRVRAWICELCLPDKMSIYVIYCTCTPFLYGPGPAQ